MKEDHSTSTDSMAVSYFILLDNTTNNVLDARICAVPECGILTEDFETPIIQFNYLEDEFEKFIDRNIPNIQRMPEIPDWNFCRFDVPDSTCNVFTTNVKDFIQNQFLPDIHSKGRQPVINMPVVEALKRNTLETSQERSISDEIFVKGTLYVSLESKRTWLSTPYHPIDKTLYEKNELLFCYNAEKQDAQPSDIYKQLYQLSVDCPGDYPVVYMSLDLTKYNSYDTDSLKKFFINFMYQLGYSRGPYIAFLNKEDSFAYINVSNVLIFNDTYFQIRDELVDYKLEKIFHSLEKKYLNTSSLQKISCLPDQKIAQNLKDYLAPEDNIQDTKKSKSQGL